MMSPGWLLGIADVDGPETLKETRSLRAEETRTTMNRVTMPRIGDGRRRVKACTSRAEDEAETDVPTAAGRPGSGAEEEGSGVWKWLKRGKGGPTKKQPGKLPPRSDQGPTKDSRAAAADILREMQRRR